MRTKPEARFVLSCIAAGMATVVAAAKAQEAVPAQPPPAEGNAVRQVEVKGKASDYDPRRDDTVTRIVVGRAEMERYGDRNVLEVLRRVPGITIGGAGSGGEVRMGGLGAGYTQVLVDGERAPAGFSLATLAPELVERIEVLRSATAEFSTQGVAGTINVILRKKASKRQRELKLSVLRNSTFIGPNVSLTLADRSGKLAYSLAANYLYDDIERELTRWEETVDALGRRVRAWDAVLPETGDFHGLNLTPRLTWTLDGGDTLAWQALLSASRFSNEVRYLVSTRLGPPPPHPDVLTATDIDRDNLSTSLNWVNKLASGGKLDVKLGASAGEHRDTRHRLAQDGAGTPTLDSLIAVGGRNRGVTTSGKFSDSFVEGHALAAGWDAGVDVRDDSRRQRDPALPGSPALAIDEAYEARVAHAALFVQDEWTVTPALSMYAGLRWEAIRVRSTGAAFDPARSHSSVWSPLFQALWKAPGDTGHQVRLALTRTYKAPTLVELIPRRQTSVNNAPNEPDVVGNPALRPELATAVDVTFERHWGEGAMLSASLSARRISDYMTWQVEPIAGRWVNRPVNRGRASTRGVELEAKVPLRTLMEAAPDLKLRASLSRNWSDVDEVPGPHNRFAEQTPVSANAGVDYENGAFGAGASYAWRRDGLVRLSADKTAWLRMPRELEAYASWKLSPSLRLRLTVSNLLAEDEVSVTTYTDGEGTVQRRGAVWQQGLALRATVQAGF